MNFFLTNYAQEVAERAPFLRQYNYGGGDVYPISLMWLSEAGWVDWQGGFQFAHL